MSKAKKGSKENPVTSEELENLNARDYSIVEATIKDGFCNFKFEIIKGVGLGQVHGVTDKKNVITDDLRNAFADFRVHLAYIDGVFRHAGIEVTDIDQLKSDELTQDFVVTGFKIKNKKGYETIQLVGEKHVEEGQGWMGLDSPEIAMDNLGGYHWYNEILTVAKKAREEVALYAEGKCTPAEAPEEKPDKNQKSLFDVQVEADAAMDAQLEKAKVD